MNIKNYYCKNQVQTELNKLYENKEIHKYNENFEYNSENDDKIMDLELIIEMFNRGILKEKKEIV